MTQTVNNGKVYVGTQNSLVAYGLFQALNVTSGNGQSGTVATPLTSPIQVQAVNPYTGQPNGGVTLNFSDGCKVGTTACGSFNPPSAVSGLDGMVSTTYTLPSRSGTYTLTISGTMPGTTVATATATANAIAGAQVRMVNSSGGNQTGGIGTYLAKPIVIQVQDAYKNGVPGVTVNFSATNGGVVGSPSVVTNATGSASTTLLLPNNVATITVTAASTGLKSAKFTEYAVAQ